MQNGSFEGSLSGWTAFGGSAGLATDGVVGTSAARITASTTRFGIYTDYWPASNVTAGDTYTSTAWFRSDTAGPTTCVRVREWDASGTTVVAYNETCTPVGATWKQLTVAYTVKTTGDLLEAYVFANNAVSGNSFETDGVTLANTTSTPPPAPDTTITSGPAATTTATTTSFSFTSNVSGATFQCALDGAAFAACSSPMSYSGLAVGTHTFQARALDSTGQADPTPASQSWTIQAPAPAPGDLMQNGSFEGSLSGWTAFGGSAALATDGVAGTYAAKVTGTTARFGIYTDYWPVSSTTAGDTYTATAYFRSANPSPSACLRVREWTPGGSIVAYRESCPALTSTWAQTTVSYTVQSTGDQLEAYVFEQNAAAGDSFEVDAVTLTKNGSAAADPILLAAGDIASCSETWDSATADLLQRWPSAAVATLGDNAYNDGSPTDYANCYDPTWGVAKGRTHPAAGNHEYFTTGAAGYFGYFGAAAGKNGQGWYSYDVGAWHIIVLNSNCVEAGGCGPGSAQETWLRNDLQTHVNTCTLAYWHHPLFTSGSVGGTADVQGFWNDLYQFGADVVLNGHSHTYERFAPQTPGAVADASNGIREFVVGTGGEDLHGLGSAAANDEVVNDTTYGILKLTLHAKSYDWEFIPAPGQTSTFGDAGTSACH